MNNVIRLLSDFMPVNGLTIICWLVLSLILSITALSAQTPAMPRLRVEDGRVVDAHGKPFFLRGVNLGNWLLIEPGGLGNAIGQFNDQHTLFDVLRERFGETERRRLIDVYRENYITARDFDNVKRFGLNFVRIGFDYEIFEDDERPMQLRPDAFKYTDFAVREAKARGLYILFDLHGAQERQVKGKQGGRVGYCQFWDDSKAQERSLWLWAEILKRYRGDTTIMGYEPLNEPFGAKNSQLRDYSMRWYKQFRDIDPDSIAVFHGMQTTIEFYGKPADNGWTNVMFDMHFYPGSFARPTATQPITPEINTRFLQRSLPDWVKRMDKAGVPLLIGEMNVVYKDAGGGEMVRRYYDFCENQGWSIAFWTLKEYTLQGGIQTHAWMLTTNEQPLRRVDFRTSTIAEIEAAFRSLGSVPLIFDKDLMFWMSTDKRPAPLAPTAQPGSETKPAPTGEQPQ